MQLKIKSPISLYICFKPINNIPMSVSSNAAKLRKIIDKAMEDHKITKAEYDHIIHEATADGHIDAVERALLAELQDMIANKVIKLVP
jgi:uncharacterized membrane protein YebE (DUF533 family)